MGWSGGNAGGFPKLMLVEGIGNAATIANVAIWATAAGPLSRPKQADWL